MTSPCKKRSGLACTITIGTSTQCKLTIRTLEHTMSQQTLNGWTSETSPTTTFSLRDFLAKVSALLDKGEVLRTHEALAFLKSVKLLSANEHCICCLRTSKDYSVTTKGVHSQPFSAVWMNWGMMLNGRCLTADISEYLKTESECSLLQILEANPDPKYFLSAQVQEDVLRRMRVQPLTATIGKGLTITDKEQ